MKPAKLLYGLLIAVASRLQSPFLLIVRLYWGWQFIETGWGHLAHLDKVVPYFAQLGIPLPMLTAPAIGALEFAGGFLLVFGLGSRLTAFLLTCDMTVAFVAADRQALLSAFSDPDMFYAAAPFTFLLASLIVLIFGPGDFSVDSLLAKHLARKPVVRSTVKAVHASAEPRP